MFTEVLICVNLQKHVYKKLCGGNKGPRAVHRATHSQGICQNSSCAPEGHEQPCRLQAALQKRLKNKTKPAALLTLTTRKATFKERFPGPFPKVWAWAPLRAQHGPSPTNPLAVLWHHPVPTLAVQSGLASPACPSFQQRRGQLLSQELLTPSALGQWSSSAGAGAHFQGLHKNNYKYVKEKKKKEKGKKKPHSVNLTPPTQTMQQPTGPSREEELIRTAHTALAWGGEGGNLPQEPSTKDWLPQELGMEVTSLRDSATSHGRPASSHPCRALRVHSVMLCSFQSMQTQWPVNLCKIKIHTWLCSGAICWG